MPGSTAGLTLLSEASEPSQPGEVLVVTRNQNLWHRNGWRTRGGQPIGNHDLWERLYALTRAQTARCVLSRDYSGPDLTGRARQLAARTAHGAQSATARTVWPQGSALCGPKSTGAAGYSVVLQVVEGVRPRRRGIVTRRR